MLLSCVACRSLRCSPPARRRRRRRAGAAAPVEVQILAINDFHGNLEPPARSTRSRPTAQTRKVRPAVRPTSRARRKALRDGHADTVTVSAGDLIGASPLVSALFLDEPTIVAMNLLGLELNAVGNHEFDKGSAELLRMQNGGCEKYTTREPCAVEPFAGAQFHFLAANVLDGRRHDAVSRHRDQASSGRSRSASSA